MIIYIFDLDDTLLYKYYKNYSDIKPDIKLNNLLNKINENKIIFTNANEKHAVESLKSLNIFYNFDYIYHRDNIPKMKPNYQGYRYIQKKIFKNHAMFGLNESVEILFFDDRVENLYTAKNFGWTTILIGGSCNKDDYRFINYHFETIIVALNYFTSLF